MILNKKEIRNKTVSTTSNRSLMTKMVSSYSVFLLIIAILFGLLYYSNLTGVEEDYNLQYQSATARDVQYFEQNMQVMELFCSQLLQHSSFRSIMNLDETSTFFFDQGADVRFSLAIDVYPESLLPIKEVFAYMPLTDQMVSPDSFCSAQFYYDIFRVYPKEHYATWHNILNDESYYYKFIPMNFLTPTYEPYNYMYILNLGDIYYTDVNAIVCFVIKTEDLDKRFPVLAANTGNRFLWIENENGETVYKADDLSEKATIKFESLPSDDSFDSYSQGGSHLTLGKYTSEDTGYSYYYSFPAFDTSWNNIFRYILFVVVMMGVFILGGVLIYRISRKNVAPIIELGEELHNTNQQKHQLEEVVAKQKPIITGSYIQKLMLGTISSEDEIPYIKKHLEIPEGNLSYNILYVVAYNNSDIGESGLSNDREALSAEEFNKLLNSSLHSFLGEPFFCFSPADRTYAILLCCQESEEDSLLMDTQARMVKLHEHLLDTYGIWVFAGIGRTTDNLMNVWECYEQATEAISYTTQNYFFFPYEIIKKKSNAFYYPPEISTKLIHFITTGNTAQMLELFSLIHRENIEERSLPVNLLKYLLSDIRNTLLKARFALPSGADAETVRELDQRFDEHLSFKLCEDIALILCKLFAEDVPEDDLIGAIEKYIQANYNDPSMGLNKISDEFRISESYFSHMFKEKTGTNFSTYLENLRMTEAARLIRDTNVSLNELYIAVGYNNSTSFRRAFKKVFGVTPSAMREQK